MKHIGLQIDGSDAASYLAAIVESSHDAIISKTLDGVIVSWNKSAERLFGYSAAEAIGQHISLIIPSDRMQEEAVIIQKIKNGQSIEHFETVRMKKDGEFVDISVTISPVINNEGIIVGASKIARNIAERKRAEEEMRDFVQRRDDFVANVSHELRTPMNAVVGITNILMDSKPLTSTQSHYLETLKVSADNLLALINDVLDFSKLEHDAIFLEEIKIDLRSLVKKIHVIGNFRAKEKGIKLNIHYNNDVADCFIGDPLRIHQIVNNLVTNALKFTEKGSVDIHVSKLVGRTGSDGVVIQVKDTGIGIAPERCNAIFEKFNQGDSSIARRYGGSGLGLSICKSLVACMKGEISVESEVGVGTTFTVSLPLKSVAKPLGENLVQDDEMYSQRHRNILLVEDHESNALVVSILLEEEGLTYDIANNGLDALRKFKKTQYDVILMDIQMPELDGIDATRSIRKIEREEDLNPTPIIAMTAHVMERDKDQCLSAGMNDFLSKPFERQNLLQKISNFMNGQNSVRVMRG